MSETKWTPGPWCVGWGDGLTGPRCAPSVDLFNTDTARLPIRAGDSPVAWVLESLRRGGNVENPSPTAQMEADARLIAAAPELYEAVEKCIRAIRGLMVFENAYPPGDDANALKFAHDALAKARGEA